MTSRAFEKIVHQLESRREVLTRPEILPNEHVLAAEFSVARTTIRRALQVLEERGAVTRKQRIGTHLQPKKISPRNLRNARIGVVPPWWTEKPGSWYFSTILDGVSRWADEYDCAFSVLHAAARPLHQHQWLEKLRKQDLRGVLWVQPQEDQLPLLIKTSRLFPTVVLGRSIVGKGLHHVIPNYKRAAELIDNHLVKHGHTSYAVIGKNVFDPYSEVWIQSFRDAYHRRRAIFHTRPYFLDYGSFSLHRLGSLIQDCYLEDHSEVKALVFLSSGDLCSLQHDVRFVEKIQRDLSVMTFNYGNAPIESVIPGLNISHITCDWSEMSYQALDTLDMLVSGHQVPENTYREVFLSAGDTVRDINDNVAVA